MSDLTELAERCEAVALMVAKTLFNEFGVAKPYDNTPVHIGNAAYAANLFTIAAALRATLNQDTDNG